jgi:hypothetical protein
VPDGNHDITSLISFSLNRSDIQLSLPTPGQGALALGLLINPSLGALVAVDVCFRIVAHRRRLMSAGETHLIVEEGAWYALDDFAPELSVLIEAPPGEHDVGARSRGFAQCPPDDDPLDEQNKSAADPYR